MYRDINTHRSTGEYQSLYAAHHFQPMADPKLVPPESTLVITQAKGMHVSDSECKRYIDGMSGLWCTAVGYGREELVEAVSSQMRELSF